MSIFTPRDNYKPFEYDFISKPLIEAMWAGHWTVNEFTFSSDVQDYNTKLSKQEQELIKRASLLISQVEVAVKSYWSNIGKLIPKPEIGDMGAVFGGIEVIHSRAYSEILNKLGFNDEFQNILSEEFIKGRVRYLNKYINKHYEDDRKNICYSLALFTLFTENVSLFSQFFIILGFNRFRGILKDMANVVQYTSKEENLHAEGGMALLTQIRKEHPEIFDEEFEQRIIEESIEAYMAECNLIEWMVGDYSNEFVSQDILKAYVKRRLNESLVRIGLKEVFQVEPHYIEQTQWMEDEVFASALTDFFYKKPIEYQRKMRSFSSDKLF